jgi:hypothetical protein
VFRVRVAPVCLALALACVSFPVAAQRPSLGALSRDVEAGRRQTAPPAQPAPPAAPAAAPVSGSVRWKSEQEWIVSDISSAIKNIAAAANGTRDGGPATARAAAGPGGAVTLAITDHIWAAPAYVPMAKAALGSQAVTCRAADEQPLIGALLDPTTVVLHRENIRISESLTRAPRCPGIHEEAALLIGSLALREAAGIFTDTRRLLSRMTAHLAVADALRGEAGRSRLRVLADTMQLTLIGREKDALDRLRALGDVEGNLDLQAWDRALRIRNTQDWRLLTAPRRATLFEQLTWFRAAMARLGEDGALARYDALEDPADVVDWGRVLLEPANGAGVDGGNRFGTATIAGELDDIARVWTTFFTGEPTQQKLFEALDEEPQYGPGGARGLWVLDWGTWAAASQRHLMMAINAYDTHLQRTLGLPDDAKEYRESVRTMFGGLRLFPLVAISFAGTPDQVRDSLLTAAQLARTRPDLFTDWMWKCLIMKEPTAPASANWFYPFFPMGTLFDVEHRPYAAHGRSRFTAAQIAEFRERAPYSRDLAFEAAKAVSAPTLASLAAVYGGMAEYDISFAEALSKQVYDNPAEYGRRLERMAQMEPGWRVRLAGYYADHARTADAVREYELWLATAQNEVMISNSIDWLLRHYFETGEIQKAATLADRAAGTGSYGGLMARASLHDWLGETADAERVLKTALDRYEMKKPYDLVSFQLRHGRTGPEVDRQRAVIFPTGMKRVTKASFRGKPRTGAVVEDAGETGRRNGLRSGDIVVAVDGIAVQDYWQYRVAADMRTDPAMRLIVWRADGYHELQTRLRFGWAWWRIHGYTAATPRAPGAPAAAAAASGAPSTPR